MLTLTDLILFSVEFSFFATNVHERPSSPSTRSDDYRNSTRLPYLLVSKLFKVCLTMSILLSLTNDFIPETFPALSLSVSDDKRVCALVDRVNHDPSLALHLRELHIYQRLTQRLQPKPSANRRPHIAPLPPRFQPRYPDALARVQCARRRYGCHSRGIHQLPHLFSYKQGGYSSSGRVLPFCRPPRPEVGFPDLPGDSLRTALPELQFLDLTTDFSNGFYPLLLKNEVRII
jgi:hypothetical protein